MTNKLYASPHRALKHVKGRSLNYTGAQGLQSWTRGRLLGSLHERAAVDSLSLGLLDGAVCKGPRPADVMLVKRASRLDTFDCRAPQIANLPVTSDRPLAASCARLCELKIDSVVIGPSN